MPPKAKSLTKIIKLFEQKKYWLIEQLCLQIDRAEISIRRYIKQIGYYSSFTHNSRWYTLKSIPKFDKNGLWFIDGIGFSKHGNLKKTILHFINKNHQGLRARDLQKLLSTPCYAVLNHMYKSKLIDRVKSASGFIYISANETKKQHQLHRIQAQQTQVVAKLQLNAITAVYVLVEYIKNPDASFKELSIAVTKYQVIASSEAIERLFEEHDLKKKKLLLIQLFGQYRQQANEQLTPHHLFKQLPQLRFMPETQLCPIDKQPLKVLKTERRLVKAMGIGTFEAHITELFSSEHKHLGSFKSNEISKLVPPVSRVSYDVIVETGRLRFQHQRKVEEIADYLFKQHAVEISNSEVEVLINKFTFYVAAVHQESAHLIKQFIVAQGGYILHLDATCEGNSPKFMVSIDSVSNFVLHSAKITSENTDEIYDFLKQIVNSLGEPLAVVSDLSKAIIAAVQKLLGDIPHYLCHFLAAIGKALFEKEHQKFQKALSKAGISGKLKQFRKKIADNFETLSISEIENYLKQPKELEKTAEVTEMYLYALIFWILDHPSLGHGYGFPFDQRYLNFFQRLQTAYKLLDEVKSFYSTQSDNDKLLWKLFHLIQPIICDSALKKTKAQYKTKLAVFTDLRHALGIAPESNVKALRQNSALTSDKQMPLIKIEVEEFMQKLQHKIDTVTDNSIKNSYKTIQKRILSYWEQLFAAPFEVEVNGEKRQIQVQRTNNILEHGFRSDSYAYRRIHGNRSIRRNLEKIPEQVALVKNLENPNYLKLVYGDQNQIAKRFSQIDVKIIREMAEKHKLKKGENNSQNVKRVCREPLFTKQLKAAFAVVAT